MIQKYFFLRKSFPRVEECVAFLAFLLRTAIGRAGGGTGRDTNGWAGGWWRWWWWWGWSSQWSWWAVWSSRSWRSSGSWGSWWSWWSGGSWSPWWSTWSCWSCWSSRSWGTEGSWGSWWSGWRGWGCRCYWNATDGLTSGSTEGRTWSGASPWRSLVLFSWDSSHTYANNGQEYNKLGVHDYVCVGSGLTLNSVCLLDRNACSKLIQW